jgi:UDP-N-acetylglucosamine 2-epimerase
VRESILVNQVLIYDDLLRVYTSSREKERVKEITARARNPYETRESSEKIISGTAANVYKEMQEATKNNDEII